MISHPIDPPLRTSRLARAARHRRLNRLGIKATKAQYIWRIETAGVNLPTWVEEYRRPGFTAEPNILWTLTRGALREVCGVVRMNGGTPHVTRMEWRRCQVCGRELIGANAGRLRMQHEATVNGRELPCDPECKKRNWK